MLEILEKMILAGAGFASLTKEKIEEIVETLIKKGQIQAKDKNVLVKRLLKATQKVDKNMEKKIKDIALDVVKNSQKQIDVLDKKLAKLASMLETRKGKKK